MQKRIFFRCFMIAAVMAIAAASCRPGLPELEKPHIRGEVEGLSDSMSDSGITGFIWVAGEQEQDTYYDRALVAVTGHTQIYKRQRERLSKAGFDEIRYGGILEVWFSGPVTASDPVQAEAETIIILD